LDRHRVDVPRLLLRYQCGFLSRSPDADAAANCYADRNHSANCHPNVNAAANGYADRNLSANGYADRNHSANCYAYLDHSANCYAYLAPTPTESPTPFATGQGSNDPPLTPAPAFVDPRRPTPTPKPTPTLTPTPRPVPRLITPPPTPTTLPSSELMIDVAVTGSDVDVSWTPIGNAYGYIVRLFSAETADTAATEISANFVGRTFDFALTNVLEEGQDYFVTVTSVPDDVQLTSGTFTFDQDPDAATDFAVVDEPNRQIVPDSVTVDQHDGQVSIAWDPVPDTYGYGVQLWSGDALIRSGFVEIGTGLTFADGLQAGITYFVTVVPEPGAVEFHSETFVFGDDSATRGLGNDGSCRVEADSSSNQILQLQQAIDRCNGPVLEVVGSFFPEAEGPFVVTVDKRLTLAGGGLAELWQTSIDIDHDGVRIDGVRFVGEAPSRTSVLTIGEGAQSQYAIVTNNEFIDSLQADKSGAVVNISGAHNNLGALVEGNLFDGFGSETGDVVHAVTVGHALLNDRGSRTWNDRGSSFIGFEDGEQIRTVVRGNTFTAGTVNPSDAVIELNAPTEVAWNCISGGYNGVSTRSSFNAVHHNSFNDLVGDGALHMSDGNDNVFDSNYVAGSRRGFDLWSGQGTVLLNNTIMDSTERPGVIHAAAHRGARQRTWDGFSNPFQANDQPPNIGHQTRFSNQKTLFVNNYIELDGSILWHADEGNLGGTAQQAAEPWEVPKNMWFVRNVFTGDGELTNGDTAGTFLFERDPVAAQLDGLDTQALHLVDNLWVGEATFDSSDETMPDDDRLDALGQQDISLRTYWRPFVFQRVFPGVSDQVGASCP